MRRAEEGSRQVAGELHELLARVRAVQRRVAALREPAPLEDAAALLGDSAGLARALIWGWNPCAYRTVLARLAGGGGGRRALVLAAWHVLESDGGGEDALREAIALMLLRALPPLGPEPGVAVAVEMLQSPAVDGKLALALVRGAVRPGCAAAAPAVVRHVRAAWEGGALEAAVELEQLFGLRGAVVPREAAVAHLVHNSRVERLEIYCDSEAERVEAVQVARAAGALRLAERLVSRWGMGGLFPNAVLKRKEAQLRKLVASGKLSQAVGLCGTNGLLQAFVLRELVATGRLSGAREAREALRMGRAEGCPELEAVAIPDGEDVESRRFLSLQVPPDRVHFVDTEAGLQRAWELAFAEPGAASGDGVGLDAEWEPEFYDGGGGGGQSPVSILQLATAEHVVIVDMLALGAGAEAGGELDAALSAVLANPRWLKLGFAFAGDLARLRRSYPALRCWARCAPVLDGLDLLEVAAPGTSKKKVGLSRVAQELLGMPLSKTCQCSAWAMRSVRRGRPATAPSVHSPAPQSPVGGTAGLRRERRPCPRPVLRRRPRAAPVRRRRRLGRARRRKSPRAWGGTGGSSRRRRRRPPPARTRVCCGMAWAPQAEGRTCAAGGRGGTGSAYGRRVRGRRRAATWAPGSRLWQNNRRDDRRLARSLHSGRRREAGL